MSIQLLARLTRAYCYAVAPYLCLFLALPAGRLRGVPRAVLGVVAATAAFLITATVTTRFSLNWYHVIHPCITVLGATLLIVRWLRAGGRIPALHLSLPAAAAASIVILAFAVRLLPILIGGESLGGGDARFHNILAEKIMCTGKLPHDWLPFAPIPVMYPQATHTLAAFLAVAARCPVHSAINFMFPVVGALTTAMIYLLAHTLFRSSRAAGWSAACYAFLTVWGSLDYYRWGGLPNALGMLLLCAMLFIILNHGPSRPGGPRIPAALGAALFVPAILLTHHYTLVVTGIMLTAVAVFTADSGLRRFTLATAAISVVLTLPLLAFDYMRFLPDIGSTNVLVYREPVRTALFYLQHMGPGLMAAFLTALLLLRRTTCNAAQLAVLAWFTGLFAAFVFLEYVCRAGVLLLTRGQDCFSCLTPSRMLTDMVYPMAILCGALPASDLWQRHRTTLTTAGLLVALTTSATVCREQSSVGVFPEFSAAARWLAGHSRPNAMIVGSLPHLEYLAGKETSDPPLPASEQRNHPALLWKRNMQSFDDWLAWERASRRPVYFVMPAGAGTTDHLNLVFSNGKVDILTTSEPEHEGISR